MATWALANVGYVADVAGYDTSHFSRTAPPNLKTLNREERNSPIPVTQPNRLARTYVKGGMSRGSPQTQHDGPGGRRQTSLRGGPRKGARIQIRIQLVGRRPNFL